MKTLTLKLSILILIIGLSFNAFTQTINIDSTFYADTEIYPFSQVDSIYSLNMSGHITLNSDTSLIRIILTDTLGNEFMIYEAYPLITTEMNFSIYDECDETCYLNEFNPNSLIIYTIDASVYINNLSYSTIPCDNCESQQYNAKRQKDFEKIQLMNINIIARGMDWVAGDNYVVQSYNYIKERKYGYKYNIQGFDYYESGVFEFISAYPVPENNASIVKEFDWRNRHGANIIGSPYYGEDFGWITPFNVEPGQGDCHACWAFAPIAVFETVLNLYYNNHYDFALSEQEVISCSNGGDCDGGYVNIVMIHFKLNGAKFYECYEYLENDTACNDLIPLCSDPNENFKIAHWGNIDKTELAIKEHLINYGPITMGWTYTGGGHVMALIGYSYDSNENKTNWVFRNSDPSQIITMKLPLEIISYLHYLREPIPNLNDQPDCHCFDNDNDGWHNWGIGDNHNICIGDNIPVQIDSDDNNSRIGSYDDNYYGVPVAPTIMVKHGEIIIPDGGIYTFYGATTSLTFQIYNEGNAQLNLKELGSTPNQGPIYISGTNASEFYITEDDEPESNQIPMETGVVSFTIHYTGSPSEANIAEIRIDLDEFDMDDFVFGLAHTEEYCTLLSPPEVISGTEEWTGFNIKERSIRVVDGGVLTITGNIGFVEGAYLNIERGGKVFINGGVLTKACNTKLWNGINVSGNANVSQGYEDSHGLLKIYNGGRIEFAEIGVETTNNDDSPDPEFSGGIIYAEEADFRNNLIDVKFHPYRNTHPVTGAPWRNLSYFTLCNFQTTDLLYKLDLLNPYYPTNHLIMYSVDGIPVHGCTFENTDIMHTDPQERGKGIYSYNSGFEVKYYKPYVMGADRIRSRFNHLEYGIYALGGRTSNLISIDSCFIKDNWRGVYLSAIDYPEVIYNEFHLRSENSLFGSEDTIAGLYINDNSIGYKVEENIFYNTGYDPLSGTQKTVGVVVNNTGDNHNDVYNNSFEYLDCGIMALNDNRNSDGSQGLEIKCNDFAMCEYDIAVTQEDQYATGLGIKKEQGEDGQYTTDPSGNIFTIDPPHEDESNYYNPFSEEVKYWYHKYDGGYNIEPIEHTPFPQVDPEKVDADWTYNPDLSCPSNLSSVGSIEDLKSEMILAETKVDSTEQALATLVDGGDTPALNTEVQTSTPDEALELRNELLSESPYLSDTVMISAVQKENVLPPVMITEVLIANPQSAKSNRVMEEVDNRVNPLSDDQIADIEQGWFVQSAKEALEAKLAGHKANKYRAMYSIIRYYKNDTANPASQDSIVKILKNENRPWAKYDLAFYYLNAYDTLNSDNVMDSIPILFDLTTAELIQYNLYSDYYDIVRELKVLGKSIIQIDSSQKQTLYSIYNNAKGGLKAYVRNALIVADTLTYNEPYIFPIPGLKSNRVIMKPVGDSKNEKLFKVYPNPARTFIIVEFNSKLIESNIMIQLIDAGGKLLEITYSNARPYIALEVEHLPNGVYFIKLDSNNLQDVEKITINR